MSEAPQVSVLMVTYNQEPFIAQAVTSALAQQTSFPVEIIVGEDCSTDRTREILLALQREHAQRLRLLLHPQNIGGHRNLAAVLAACRGQYVAMLEGDDYWTDNRKLQRQVTALNAHPAWAICFHPVRRVFEDGAPPQIYPRDWTKEVATIDDLFQANFMATCSVVFRRGLFGDLPAWHREASPGDWALHLLSAAHGDIGCLPDVMADYRVHSRGIWSGTTRAARLRDTLLMFSHVDHHFQGRYRRQIDAFRVGLVETLLAELERQRQSRPPRAVPRRPRRARLSLVQEISRSLMRPLERTVRRWRGLPEPGIPERQAKAA